MNRKKVLISVWDKEGILELASFFHDNDFDIISTGGTSKAIKEYGIATVDVSKITSYKEIMDGRVKTLHPNIFGGILADRDNKNHIEDLSLIKSSPIDIVVINLYPFKDEAVEKKLDLNEAINFIDIGGPSMLRAAAKNYKSVIPLCHPSQYKNFISEFNENKGNFTSSQRISYAKQVFEITSSYDTMINEYFSNSIKEDSKVNFNFIKQDVLRYGENPHQKSTFYIDDKKNIPFKQLSGKQLSYNNYFDIESAINIVYEFDEISCSIIKHANPCGFGIGVNNLNAYLNAVKTDPISFFGGIVAFNNQVDSEVAKEMKKSFLECIVAPSFSKEAENILKKKKNLRLIEINKDKFKGGNSNTFRSVFNGMLTQTKDQFIFNKKQFEVVTKKKPNKKEYNSLLLGWKLVKFVKSNAIVFNNDVQLLGVGAGQMSRIDSVKIAINKSKENSLDLKNSVMASDAFFPFTDSLEIAAKEGVAGVIQPGGSIKDQSIIDKANELDLFMVFTKERHFYH